MLGVQIPPAAPKYMKNKDPKRWFEFEYDDGTSIKVEIVKATVLKMPMRNVAFHLDMIGPEQYLFVANEKFLPEGKKLLGFKVVREEKC